MMDRKKAADLAYAEGYRLGSASRDAEIVSLTNQRDYEYVRAENAEQERDQLRAELSAAHTARVSAQKAGVMLLDQLAAALAACKAKDEALKRWKFDSLNMPISEFEVIKEALAIQPDDSALKAWLGNPVSYLYKHSSAFCNGEFWSHRPNHNGVTATESKALYSPKGLK